MNLIMGVTDITTGVLTMFGGQCFVMNGWGIYRFFTQINVKKLIGR